LRIPCFFKAGPFEAAYVVTVLESDFLCISETVEFLVDTGASRTTICDKDAIKLGIDYNRLERFSEGMLGVGGIVNAYILRDVRLIFRREDERSHVESFERIYVSKHAVLDERIMRLPSILGRDMLNKYSFVYDKRHERAFLTDETLVH
jgi:hypothetical protein